MRISTKNIYIARALAWLAIASFLSLAVLHIFTMSMMAEGSHSCIAAAVQSQDCPETGGPVASYSFHLNALQKLLNTVPQNFFEILLVTSLLVVSLNLYLSLERDRGKLVSIRHKFKRLKDRLALRLNKQIGFWLVYLQKRDPQSARL